MESTTLDKTMVRSKLLYTLYGNNLTSKRINRIYRLICLEERCKEMGW